MYTAWPAKGGMARLPAREMQRQELEQRSAAKLTDEVLRVQGNLNWQLHVSIDEAERKEQRKRAEEQRNRLKQIEAASARAVEARKADAEKAYLQWLSEQQLDVKNGIPNRPMFKDEFERHWAAKTLAIPAWDLGIFGTAPQQQPTPQYKRRDDGTWRWEQRDINATVYQHDRHPLCKSSSRKLSALGPAEPAAQPDPDNALARLAAEVAEATNQQATAAKQQRKKEEALGMKPKTPSQPASGPGARKSKHATASAADYEAAAASRLRTGQHSCPADKAFGAVTPQPDNGAIAATRGKITAVMAAAEQAAAAAAAPAEENQEQQMANKAAAGAATAGEAAAAAGAEQQPLCKGRSAELSERVSEALAKAAQKLRAFGGLGSFGKRSSSNVGS